MSSDDGHREVVAVAPMVVMPCHFHSPVAGPRQRQCPVESSTAIWWEIRTDCLGRSARSRCDQNDLTDVRSSGGWTQFEDGVVRAQEELTPSTS